MSRTRLSLWLQPDSENHRGVAQFTEASPRLRDEIIVHALSVLLCIFFLTHFATAASIPAPSLLKAAAEARAKGYIFETSHDEIVAKAKTEGRLRVLSGLDQQANSAIRDAFKKRYPFIEVHVEEIPVEAGQRLLLEMRTGKPGNWDVNHLAIDLYPEYLPYQKKFDILGMAREGVLNIPAQMVDPANRNVVALGSDIQVIAYNTKLLPAALIPEQWTDFLRPELKGRKFVADIRTTAIASFVPAWGLEKTLEFARNLAAQKPVWARGYTRVAAGLVAGEHKLFFGPTYGSVRRAQAKDPSGSLGIKVLEPVPTRIGDAHAVQEKAGNPYAALLWLEFQAGPEGQKILDDAIPYGASVYASATVQAQLTAGKKLSLVDWSHFTKMQEYMGKTFEAYGFPKAER
ncbi:MAG TPA: extracellular solute-binding protein [Candidatus Acidoferrales bacterium]|nr:extracellular solute-binding protein [Candidatus Acidoferrales bacterium]